MNLVKNTGIDAAATARRRNGPHYEEDVMHVETLARRRSAPTMILALLFLLGTALAARATVVPQPHVTIDGVAGLDTHGIVALWTSDHSGPGHFSADILWGDGLPNSAGMVSSNGQKSFDAQGTHNYAAPGTYFGVVHVADSQDDSTADIAFTAVIRPTGLLPMALSADDIDDGDTDSDVDGVFEFGESVVLNPTWSSSTENMSAVTGSLTGFTRPGITAGEAYTLSGPSDKSSADYGSIAKLDSHDCTDGNDKPSCYKLTATLTGSRPVPHMDAVVTETLTGDVTKQWTLHMGGTFTDVPENVLFYRDIETIVHNQVTVGCNPATQFCPLGFVTRAQMAAFVSHAFEGSDAAVPTSGTVNAVPYDCTAGGNSLFTDIGPDNIFCKHVHYIASRGITFGCGGTQFCPWNNLVRGEAAVFIARSQPPVNPGGNGDVPMAYADVNTGRSYDCNEATASLPFSDVSATDQFCRFINFVWALGIVDGYPDGTYKPNLSISRQEMAKLITRGYQLKLYHP